MQTTPRDSSGTLVFWRQRSLLGDAPIPSEIYDHSDIPFWTQRFRPIFAHSASTVRAGEKSSISTNRKSTTRFRFFEMLYQKVVSALSMPIEILASKLLVVMGTYSSKLRNFLCLYFWAKCFYVGNLPVLTFGSCVICINDRCDLWYYARTFLTFFFKI